MRTKHVVLKSICLLAAGLALTGCGGGENSVSTSADRQVPSSVRPQSDALDAASAADVVMTVAEIRYFNIFKGSSTTQSAGPFAYRSYHESGTNLGIVVRPAAGFPMGHVFVQGGVFGPDLIDLGPSIAFVNLAAPTVSDADNGCSGIDARFSPGYRYSIVRNISGSLETGTVTIDGAVGSPVQFQGKAVGQSTVTTRTNTVQNGLSLLYTSTEVHYESVTGNEVTEYGTTGSGTSMVNGVSSGSNYTTVYTPPFVDRQYKLQSGQSMVQTRVSETTSTSSATAAVAGGPTTTTTSISTFIGREAVTVPAGTYAACKYEAITPGQNGRSATISFAWTMDGTGLLLRSMSSVPGASAPYRMIEAASILRNGERV